MRNKNYIGGLTKENLKGFVILVLIFLYVLSALLNLTGFFWGYVLFLCLLYGYIHDVFRVILFLNILILL
ncbi:hypothetical protein DQU39_00110 (plasmid) [Staphylococcus aureus]|nr:hypothetical protein DQU39_00110 [Staphylococcus aureus]